MFSLQKALGKDDRFFGLLESSAAEAHASAQALTLFFSAPPSARSLAGFAQSRRKEKQLNERIIETLATQVMTMFEREDVEALSKALYKIPKTVEKFAERFVISLHLVKDVDFSRHTALLDEASAPVPRLTVAACSVGVMITRTWTSSGPGFPAKSLLYRPNNAASVIEWEISCSSRAFAITRSEVALILRRTTVSSSNA